jgi:nitrilase
MLPGLVLGKEDIMIAELDMKQIAYSQFVFDPVGHYSRPDIFKLLIDKEKQESSIWIK